MSVKNPEKLVSGSISMHDIAVFCRELATVLTTGSGVIEAINDIAMMSSNRKLRRILDNIASDIVKGYSLTDSFKKYPRIFNNLFITMLTAGEESGNIGESLLDIADYMDKSVHLRRRISAAAIYPIAIVLFILCAFLILFVFLVPRITAVYVTMGAELPLITRTVIGLSEMLVSGGYLLVMAITALAASGWLLYKSRQGRYIIDALILKIPFLGNIIKKALIARLFHTIGALLNNGIDIAHALDTAGGITGNMYISQVILQVRVQVLGGSSLSDEFGNYDLFSEMTVKMAAVGESTGNMSEVFLKVTDYYTAEVDAAVSGASAMLEPMIIIMLSVLVGIFVLSMYLPIFNLAMTMLGSG